MPPTHSGSRGPVIAVGLICLVVYAILTLLLGGFARNRAAMLVDLVLLVAGIFAWIFFFAQFTLPVRAPRERLGAAARLLLYLLGLHGPIVRIENGQVIQRDVETKKRGPGVLLVDAASAAVLRTGTAFTRPVGPGIHFLRYDRRRRSGEYLAGVVDLRWQTRAVGPAQHEEPFAARGRQESAEAYKQRQDRRWETSSLTRDGIEVIPNVEVTFRIEAQPGEGGTGFGYNPVSVWRAVTAEGVDPDASADTQRGVPWEWLPGRLAVDVWREYLRMFTLEALFAETGFGQTGIEVVADMLQQRLTQPKVVELNEFGAPTGHLVTSPEYALLVQRGLRAQSAALAFLRLPAPVEEQLTRRWESTWLVEAQRKRELLEDQGSYAQDLGQLNALRDLALSAAPAIENPGPHSASLTNLADRLLEGTLRLVVRDPDLHRKALV
ncbi:MAG TPA: hypothetical protein VHO48_03765, partial [Anaerolineaceae bacterium]|nr:hypothetical protein [Anaerolineaceae bacterium]